MDKLIDFLKDLTPAQIAAMVIALSILLVIVFYKGWQHARTRSRHLQKELAQRGAWLADTKDKLYLEERNAEALTDALDRANDAIAGEGYKLGIAREKIAALNVESDAVYESYLSTQAELKTSEAALQYWQYFARRALKASRTNLESSREMIKESLLVKNGAAVADALELVEYSTELSVLADTEDLRRHIRELRADGTREVIHLVPRLKRLIAEKEAALGERFIAIMPEKEKPILFAGSWVHLELVLTTLLDNAIKHSVESSPMEFEFTSADRMATFLLTNISPTAVSESVIRAANEMMIGDLHRPRFGLYLIEQIAIGYRAIFKIENVGFADDGSGHLVRMSFTFSLR